MREIEDLKADLKVAIAKEDFEKAAEIRDQIKCLETRGVPDRDDRRDVGSSQPVA